MRMSSMAELVQLKPNLRSRLVWAAVLVLCASVALVNQCLTSGTMDALSVGLRRDAPAGAEWRDITQEMLDEHEPEHKLGELNGYSELKTARVVADPRRAALVASPLSGQLETLFVAHGDYVERGDPLIKVASTKLASLRADISRSQREVADAERELALLQEHARTEPFALTRLRAASLRVDRAKREHASTTARIRALRIEEDRTQPSGFIVRAPRDGVVAEMWLRPGQSIQAKQPVMFLADKRDGLLVEVDVPAPEVHELAIGTRASITLPEADDTDQLYAQIDKISDTVDRRHNTVRVHMAVQDERLQVNQTLHVQFLVQGTEPFERL